MPGVGAHAARSGEHAEVLVPARAQGQSGALEDALEERAVGARRRRGADLLVVEGRQDGDLAAVGGEQGGQRGVDRDEVVLPLGGEELRADDGRGLGVVGVGVHADDVAGGRPGGLGDPPEDGTVPRRPDRVQMPLAVERQRVLAVQVRGELRDEHDRFPGREEALGAVGADQAPGDAQVAVEPGVGDEPAVGFDVHLRESVSAGVRLRLELEAGRIGVRADDAEPAGRPGALRHPPGDHGPAPPEVVPSRPCRPRLLFALAGVSGRVEPPRRLVRRVVRARRGFDEPAEIRGVAEHRVVDSTVHGPSV